MKHNPTVQSQQSPIAAHTWLLALLLTFVSVTCIDFSSPGFSQDNVADCSLNHTVLPLHNGSESPELHRDAVPPLITQLTNSIPTCARSLSRSQTSHSSIVRETIRKNLIYNKLHIQQNSFRTHIAQQVANGAHTYRCGVLII